MAEQQPTNLVSFSDVPRVHWWDVAVSCFEGAMRTFDKVDDVPEDQQRRSVANSETAQSAGP
jgi:hypothetical protein